MNTNHTSSKRSIGSIGEVGKSTHLGRFDTLALILDPWRRRAGISCPFFGICKQTPSQNTAQQEEHKRATHLVQLSQSIARASS